MWKSTDAFVMQNVKMETFALENERLIARVFHRSTNCDFQEM